MIGLRKKLSEAYREIGFLDRTLRNVELGLSNALAKNHTMEAMLKESRERESTLIAENEQLAYRCHQLSKALLETTGVPEKGRGSF